MSSREITEALRRARAQCVQLVRAYFDAAYSDPGARRSQCQLQCASMPIQCTSAFTHMLQCVVVLLAIATVITARFRDAFAGGLHGCLLGITDRGRVSGQMDNAVQHAPATCIFGYVYLPLWVCTLPFGCVSVTPTCRCSMLLLAPCARASADIGDAHAVPADGGSQGSLLA